MKRLLAVALLTGLMSGAAAANESAERCRAYVAEHGGDDSGCDCLGEAAEKDAALAAAIAAIETPADLEAADDKAKAAIAACFPNAGEG